MNVTIPAVVPALQEFKARKRWAYAVIWSALAQGESCFDSNFNQWKHFVSVSILPHGSRENSFINIIMGIFFFVHCCNIQYLVVYYMDICRRLIEIWKQANWNMKTKKKITTILTIIWTNVHIIAALQKKHVFQFFYRWNMSKCENKIFPKLKFGDTVAIKRVAIFLKKKSHMYIWTHDVV